MAISLFGSSTALISPGGNSSVITFTRPAGAGAGHVAYAFWGAFNVGGAYNSSLTMAPAGWTRLVAYVTTTAGGSYLHELWRKVLTASEPTSYQFQMNFSPSGWGGVLSAWSGVNLTSPEDAVGPTLADTSATPTLAGVTTSAPNGVIFTALNPMGGGSSNDSPNPPSGMTRIAKVRNNNSELFAVSDWQTIPTAGATGGRTYSLVAASVNRGVLVALRPANSAPTAATLTAPSNGATVDLAGTPTFQATYNDPDAGDAISAYLFRRKLSGAPSYEYWNAGTGAWQSTEVKNAASGVGVGQTFSLTFPTAAWVNGSPYNWSIAFEDAQGVRGPYAADFTVTGEGPATYSVTGPAGTVTATSRPTVTFSRSHPTNVAQARFRVKIFSAAQYTAGGFNPDTSAATAESGWIVSETLREWTPAVDLANTTTFRAYVQGESAAGVRSAWAFSTFTLSLTAPTAPTLLVTPQPDLAEITVTVTGTHSPASFPVTTFRVERSDDDEQTWQTVRGAAALPPDGALQATVIDREAPPHRPASYRAFTVADV